MVCRSKGSSRGSLISHAATDIVGWRSGTQPFPGPVCSFDCACTQDDLHCIQSLPAVFLGGWNDALLFTMARGKESHSWSKATCIGSRLDARTSFALARRSCPELQHEENHIRLYDRGKKCRTTRGIYQSCRGPLRDFVAV